MSVSKRLDTDMPPQRFSTAWAKIGAVGTMRMFFAAFTSAVGAMLSVMTSDFVTDFSTRSTAGPESGPVNAALGGLGLGPFTMLNSGFGAMVGYLTPVLPLVVIFQTWSLAAIDRNLIEAAGNLGASPVRTLVSVIIPAAKTGLVLGAVFAFILTFGDFVSPFYLGGSKPPTLTILIIDTTKSGQQWPRAAVVAILMIVTLFAVATAALKAAYGRRAGS